MEQAWQGGRHQAAAQPATAGGQSAAEAMVREMSANPDPRWQNSELLQMMKDLHVGKVGFDQNRVVELNENSLEASWNDSAVELKPAAIEQVWNESAKTTTDVLDNAWQSAATPGPQLLDSAWEESKAGPDLTLNEAWEASELKDSDLVSDPLLFRSSL